MPVAAPPTNGAVPRINGAALANGASHIALTANANGAALSTHGVATPTKNTAPPVAGATSGTAPAVTAHPAARTDGAHLQTRKPTKTTKRRAKASRANGALSRGAVTAEGKARSAQNGVRHGVLSSSGGARDAAEAAFLEAIGADIDDRFAPVTALERHQAEEYAFVLLRQRRLRRLEAEVEDALLAPEDSVSARLPTHATLLRYRARIARDLADARTELSELCRARAARARRAQGFPSGAMLSAMLAEADAWTGHDAAPHAFAEAYDHAGTHEPDLSEDVAEEMYDDLDTDEPEVPEEAGDETCDDAGTDEPGLSEDPAAAPRSRPVASDERIDWRELMPASLQGCVTAAGGLDMGALATTCAREAAAATALVEALEDAGMD